MSWVEFNRRVLEEALDPELPLLEKVKFVSIFSSNLDEFYMIRIAGIKEQIAAKVEGPTIDGLTPIEELRRIEATFHPMLRELMALWKDVIVPGLADHGVEIIDVDEAAAAEREALDRYFKREIFPVLTPLASDPGRPFPYISNLSLSIAALIKDRKGEKHFARVKVPSNLDRLVPVHEIMDGKRKKLHKARFVWLGDLIKRNLGLLFPKMEILEARRFRITRDTDVEIQEDEADDLLKVIEENIRQRRFGNVVRLEVEANTPDYMIETLAANLLVRLKDVHVIDGPLGLSSVMQLYDLPIHELKQKPYYPVTPSVFEEEEDVFSIVKSRDVMLHHPYESFAPVIDFVKRAARDPDVLAIKQTLYRVGSDSPIIRALIEAAERKKQVAVLVELKARFDEENNIFWARELEKAGVHVVYGLVGLKTHSKLTLVVRRELDGVRRYVHVGTGNYNASTAKLYTDIGMLTADEDTCADVSDVFNYLTGYSGQTEFRKLLVAPVTFRDRIIEKIFREIAHKKAGKEARVKIKMNSLVDPAVIAAFYEASRAGVKIDLNVRGICCLKPGVEGLSENIRVVSVVGRFLEHSRIFYFLNGGDEEVYIGSADLMPRNLDRRVETAAPVQDPRLKRYLADVVLDVMLRDNRKARELTSDGTYRRVEPGENERPINSQEWLMANADDFSIEETPPRTVAKT